MSACLFSHKLQCNVLYCVLYFCIFLKFHRNHSISPVSSNSTYKRRNKIPVSVTLSNRRSCSGGSSPTSFNLSNIVLSSRITLPTTAPWTKRQQQHLLLEQEEDDDSFQHICKATRSAYHSPLCLLLHPLKMCMEAAVIQPAY